MLEEEKKSNRFLDKVLISVAVFDLIFVIAMVIVFCIFQSVPDTLIMAVFGATFGECGCCAYVFKQKIKNKNEEIDSE